MSCCLYCLGLVAVISQSLLFWCCPQVAVSMNRRYRQFWWIPFLLLFLTPIWHRSDASSLRFLFSESFLKFFPLPFQEWYLTEYLNRFLYLWWDSCNSFWFWDITLYTFFFHLHLFDGVRFKYPQLLIIIINISISIIVTLREFFILFFTDGISLESEWQQVISDLLESSYFLVVFYGTSTLGCHFMPNSIYI